MRIKTTAIINRMNNTVIMRNRTAITYIMQSGVMKMIKMTTTIKTEKMSSIMNKSK